jgi:hypothetical protein
MDIYRHWNVSSVHEVSNKNAAVSGIFISSLLEMCHCQQKGLDDLAIAYKSLFYYRYVY